MARKITGPGQGAQGAWLGSNLLAGMLELRNDATLGGDYYFKSFSNNGTLTLKIDLTNGPVNIYVDGHITIGQRAVLWVTNAAIATHPDATDGYLPISHPDAQALAALIYWETTGRFDIGGADTTLFTTIFGGTLYSTWEGTGNGITNTQHIDWFGALWSKDTIVFSDHSRYTFVPLQPPGCVIDTDCSYLDDQCNTGVCNAGTCETVPKADSTPCEDGDFCTSETGTP